MTRLTALLLALNVAAVLASLVASLTVAGYWAIPGIVGLSYWAYILHRDGIVSWLKQPLR